MKRISLLLTASCISGAVFAQSAIDAYRFSQPDLRGTARFMSMGGAFGALGGDLSTLSQNPAGIGVYRSSEIGFTLDLDLQNATSQAPGVSSNIKQTKFSLDNIGGVATMRFGDAALRNLNIGFTFNKSASFNRRYTGVIPNLKNSMSNYIAGIANNEGITVADVQSTQNYDPYNPTDGGYAANWLAILGYDSYLINPNGNPDHPTWSAQYGEHTTGTGNFDVMESGSVSDYNIALGGNIKDKFYWGMNFDIVTLNYNLNAQWGEDLTNAYVYNPHVDRLVQTDSQWRLTNLYSANGTGFQYQLGFIYKPIQEFRVGFAFHTPTWYSLTETYSAGVRFNYFGDKLSSETNNGRPGTQDYNFNSPWKLIFSAAGVIGNKCIVSADYQLDLYKSMKFSEPSAYGVGYDDYWGWDWDYYSAGSPKASSDYYEPTNQDIKNVYRTTSTLRLGAEYRVTPSFSVRAGYSFVASPVEASAKSGKETIYTAGTLPNYRFDNTTNYVTCGLGYRYKGFYIDLAYVYKHMDSTYHAYTPDPTAPEYPSPSAKLKLDNSRIVLSTGLKF